MTFATPLAILVAATFASPLWATHANPWMTPEDTVLMQYHEENLEQSEDTPGEDEMLEVMTGSAVGKIEHDAGPDDGLGPASGYAGGGARGAGSEQDATR